MPRQWEAGKLSTDRAKIKNEPGTNCLSPLVTFWNKFFFPPNCNNICFLTGKKGTQKTNMFRLYPSLFLHVVDCFFGIYIWLLLIKLNLFQCKWFHTSHTRLLIKRKPNLNFSCDNIIRSQNAAVFVRHFHRSRTNNQRSHLSNSWAAVRDQNAPTTLHWDFNLC